MHPTLLCPVCRAPLSRGEHTYACQAGHSYDIARHGYVNLLSGKPPAIGDNREMIAARRRTLESGIYAPLRAALTEAAMGCGGLYLDAGCGEGYYTEALAGCADATVGVDISKEALRAAHRRLPTATLSVASVYHLPIADASVSLLSCIFAPGAMEEYHRVLAPGGLFLWVIPGARHLYSMKTILYETPYENEVAPYHLDGFRFCEDRAVRYEATLASPEAIADLFAMTPYFYRTPTAGRERLLALERLTVEADFHILTYRKESV